MAGKLLQLLELCMAVLSSCIHILFSEILDDITLNFHSLGLIQYSLRPISNRKLPRDHNLPTLLNTVCVVSPFINELIRKENDHCFRSSNCTVQPARQPRTTAATAHGSHGIFPVPNLIEISAFGAPTTFLSYLSQYLCVSLDFRLVLHRSSCPKFCALSKSKTTAISIWWESRSQMAVSAWISRMGTDID
jgi:hypothetical protein